MPKVPIYVLVVEDHEPFRRFVVALLQERPELQILAEVGNGLEAVQKVQELDPDLVLLDIGLPVLNGIEAAQRIHSASPKSKILFVSQETSADIVQAALGVGAQGYVVKIDAGRELVKAVDAAVRGETFLSTSVAGQNASSATHSQRHGATRRNEAVNPDVSELPQKAGTRGQHKVLFFRSDRTLTDGWSEFITAALQSGNAVILVATKLHRESVLAKLQANSVDVITAMKQGRIFSLDAAEILSAIMADGRPDAARFLHAATDLIKSVRAAAGGGDRRVLICGECDPPLWTIGEGEAAIAFEQLWNRVAVSQDVDILCAYPSFPICQEDHEGIYKRICSEHSAVYSR